MTALLHQILRRLGAFSLRAGGWLALAYCGYWLALLLDRVFPRLAVYLAAGATTIEWRATPFSAWVLAPGLNFSFLELSSNSWASILSLFLEIWFLVWLLARKGQRVAAHPGPRAAAGFLNVRICLYFAALWVVVFFGQQVFVFVSEGWGRVGTVLRFIGVETELAAGTRLALGLLLAMPVLVAGVAASRRLLAGACAMFKGQVEKRGAISLAMLAVVAPMLLLLTFTLNASLRGPGRAATMTEYLVAGTFCLLPALLALRGPGTVGVEVFPSRGAPHGAVPLLLGIALYAGLANVQAARAWLSDQALARHASENFIIAYQPGSLDEAALLSLTDDLESELAILLQRLSESPGGMQLRVVVYPDSVAKRTATGNDRHASVHGTTIRAVLRDAPPAIDPTVVAAALLQSLWSAPADSSRVQIPQRWVERWLTRQWRGRPPEEWAATIASEEGQITLAELLAPEADHDLSPLVREPLGAAWVELIHQRFGIDGLRRLYAHRDPVRSLHSVAGALGSSGEILEREWREHLSALQATHPPPTRPPRHLPAAFFMRGISFSHEGWGSRRGGYDSPEAQVELGTLRQLGVNAIAAVPYGWADPDGGGISYTATDETDEELAHLLRVARGLGMKVMLKPQLWVRGGRFTGTLRFDQAETRRRWMQSYRRFILHYARLAELESFDLLCIGTELAGLTAHGGEWRRLIAEVRRVYRGPLTYAANWGTEFESLSFWDELDYIGLNNYYPLAADGNNSPTGRAHPAPDSLFEAARSLAERIEAVQRRWGRPVMFTEIGYPSAPGGTARPWVQGRTREVRMEEQAAAYEAGFAAFAERPWFRGMFWWKWPSNGRGGGPDDPTYTPRGKPAADVLRAWYLRMANGQKTD